MSETLRIISKLISLDYNKRRIYLRKKTKPAIPRLLYKYATLNIDDTLSIKKANDIIVKSKLYYSSSKKFNDPFDCSVKFIATGNIEEKRKRIKLLMKIAGETKKYIDKNLSRFVINSSNQLPSIIKYGYDHFHNNLGICSFTLDPRNILMWSHYSYFHTGICYIFDVARDVENFVIALPVEYNIEFPVFDWIKDSRETIIKGVLRKHEDWRYEKERRIIKIDGANKYQLFKPESLSGIILGCRIRQESIDKLSELLADRYKEGHPKITLFKAVKHNEQYRLVIKKHS